MLWKNIINAHKFGSPEWATFHTEGTLEHKIRKIVWWFHVKLCWYYRWQWKKGIIRGTLLTKNGIRVFNNWIMLIPPFGEFAISDGMKTVHNFDKVGGYQNCLKLIEFALKREGLAVEVPNNFSEPPKYEFTERGRKLLRHGSLKKLIKQELSEDKANAARNLRDIYWWLPILIAFVAGCISSPVTGKLTQFVHMLLRLKLNK